MFTGLVEERGHIVASRSRGDGLDLRIGCCKVLTDIEVGDSVAVNGCCLTVIAFDDDGFDVQLVEETISRTNLGSLLVGDPVNLERPLAANGRFGGHIVQGHIDGPALLEKVEETSSGGRIHRYSVARPMMRYLVEKGSVTVDGVSLTVACTGDDWLEVALIPHTLTSTNLSWTNPGYVANMEVDLVAKYIESLLTGYRGIQLAIRDTEGDTGAGDS